jgi:hypothetical protein
LSRRASCWTVGIVIVVGGCIVSGNDATEIPEFGFAATVPDGLPICKAESASHIHGVGTVLVGSDCDNRERQPAFNVWAEYNVLFKENALEVLGDDPRCSGSTPVWGQGEWANAIGGLKTAMCRREKPDGAVDFVFVAQAGKWPDDQDNTAYINYTVNFNSTRERLARDVDVLNQFLNSIKISPPGH